MMNIWLAIAIGVLAHEAGWSSAAWAIVLVWCVDALATAIERAGGWEDDD